MPLECDLKLECFLDDGVTLAWEVGTASDHATPYLQLPSRYASQEIDVAEGGASIGTVGVTVIDKAQTDGDQDSGWMTQRLQSAGQPAVAGRRCRLSRYVDGAWVMVADGPAGTPRLDASFAAYTWDIRDTRETERKSRAFELGLGTTVAVPRGVLPGYHLDAGTATYLVDPAVPLRGQVQLVGHADARRVSVEPYNTLALRTIRDDVYDALMGELTWGTPVFHGVPTGWTQEYFVTFGGRLLLKWRPWAGGAWHDIGATLRIHGTAATTTAQGPPYLAGSAALISNPVWKNDLDPNKEVLYLYFGDSAAVPDLPADLADVAIMLVWQGEASELFPLHIQDTAGDLVKDAYDGLYSPRDEDGNVVPTGVRYDAAALALMTTPVRARITEPVDDVRAWLEEFVYAPTGWAPALDADGRVSPVSQIAPASTLGLDLITDVLSRPAADWQAGDRIINVVELSYPRDYVPADPLEADGGDGLSSLNVTLRFEDALSIARHGRQTIRLDGAVFRARGLALTGASFASLANEVGYQLGQLRRTHVGGRYSLGAPAFRVEVMREELPDLRAGDWVVSQLSWLPDYTSGRRGQDVLCQVMGIDDLNCAWRSVLLEEYPSYPEPELVLIGDMDLILS